MKHSKRLIVSIIMFFIVGCGESENSSSQSIQEVEPVYIDNNMSGEALFTHEFVPTEGLGPHFNAASCAECHATPSLGGSADDKSDIVFRIGFLSNGVFSDLIGEGGPSARSHSVVDNGFFCDVDNGIGINTDVNVVSIRSSLSLFGVGIIDKIPDALIEAEAVDKGYGIHGKVNRIYTPSGLIRVGKFGWKAQKAELLTFTSEAFKNEIGLTNTLFPMDNFKNNLAKIKECDGFHQKIELADNTVKKTRDFIASLPIRNAGVPDFNSTGYKYFQDAKCHLCHKPSYLVDGEEHFLFSDFLIHNMGDGLNDNFVQSEAQGSDWRTAPLHGLGFRSTYLHDARTEDLNQAIMEHRGEANTSMRVYSNFSQESKDDLINFLKTL